MMALMSGSPGATQPALFRAWPELAGKVPWMPLGRFPTPVERVRGLVSERVELWVKRDDQSGAAYGGNKVRKLEFLLAEARAAGSARVATLGGYGSHHVLATAIYGAQAGLSVEAVVFPQPLNAHVREQLLADAAAGAQLRPTSGYLGVPLAVWRARSAPGTHWIAAGGSSVTGTLGYLSAACELREQIERGELPRPDVIYVALGSNGTAAGLLAGGWDPVPLELVAVRVTDRLVAGASKVRRLADATAARCAQLLGVPALPRRGVAPLLRVVHDQFGGGYGRSTPAAEAAVGRAAATGLVLEPTYTGKCLAALLADAASGRLDGKRVLFVHTYNGVDLSPLLARAPSPSVLPPLLRGCFD
jgi:1-aminocyclopropane-1-carboxylate deaminase/D-cysteine desulfhydrase-like pyridoxal-dependent ACC family enzyme